MTLDDSLRLITPLRTQQRATNTAGQTTDDYTRTRLRCRRRYRRCRPRKIVEAMKTRLPCAVRTHTEERRVLFLTKTPPQVELPRQLLFAVRRNKRPSEHCFGGVQSEPPSSGPPPSLSCCHVVVALLRRLN